MIPVVVQDVRTVLFVKREAVELKEAKVLRYGEGKALLLIRCKTIRLFSVVLAHTADQSPSCFSL